MQWARRPRPKRTWPQRIILAVNLVIVISALASAVVLAYAKETVSSIPRTAFGNTLAPEEEVLEGEARPAINFLLVGVDSIRSLPLGHPLRNTRGEGNTLTDTLIVLRVDPDSGDAAAMSIPRDLWVPISGVGYEGKINSALALGGSTALVRTVQDYLDIPIHRYVQVDFNGFLELVDEIGGVKVLIEHPLRDPKAQLAINETGCVNLTAEQALGYVRARTLQALIDGRWQLVDSRSDLGRIARQQDFLVLALKRAFNEGLTNPSTLKGIVDNVITEGYISLDDRTTPEDLVQLGSDFDRFDAEELRRLTLPVALGTAGDASVVRLVEGEAQEVLGVFRGEDAQTRSFRVAVRNGTGETGLADTVKVALATRFRVVEATNADSFGYETSVIRYDPSQLDAAQELERWLVAGATLEARAEDAGRPVELVVGRDWQDVLQTPRELVTGGGQEEAVIAQPVTNTGAPDAEVTLEPTPTPTPQPLARIRGCD